jgi:hypothetical protein
MKLQNAPTLRALLAELMELARPLLEGPEDVAVAVELAGHTSPAASSVSDEAAPAFPAREGSESATTAQLFDKPAYLRFIFATINEYARYADDGKKLLVDTYRHNVLVKLYAKSSLNDLNEAQLRDFRRRVTAQLELAKKAVAHAAHEMADR